MKNLTKLIVSQGGTVSPVPKTIEDKVKFAGLFPTWITVVATIVAVLILMLVLTKLLYEPIKKNFKDRQSYIQTNINEAERQNTVASSDREKANDELIIARSAAADILTTAKVQAEVVRAKEIAKAKEEAQGIISSARAEMANEQTKFEMESKAAMVDIALEAAAKVVEKEVDNKTNRKIVEDYIKAN